MKILEADITPSLVNTGKKIIIMVGTETCPHCAAIKPFFTSMASVFPDIAFYFLDASLTRGINDLVEIDGIPNISAYYNGKLLDVKEGGDINNILSILDTILAA